MKAIYLDTFAGISGNMLLGALLDAGFPQEVLREEIEKLHLGSYELIFRRVNKTGIDAQYFNVLLPHEATAEHEHQHAHEHLHEHCHAHDHEHGCGRQEHCHELMHGHHHEHRNLQAIMDIINASELSPRIKAKAEQVFRVIAAAEGKVHGKPVEEIHFHEIGAIDTIIDVVGCLLGLEYLGIEKVYVGKITTGRGFVECAHGLMPVPAPATAEILQGLPYEQGSIERELTTPTGAALVKTLAKAVSSLPEGFTGEKIAYGAGSWDLPIPNVVRLFLGEMDDASHETEIVEAGCNIDDMSGELLAYALEKIMHAGALDAWAEPVIMKKGRPAYKLCFLTEAAKLDDLLQIVFAETTTLGVRYHKVSRSVLQRRFTEVELPQGSVTVKYGVLNGNTVNVAPEYESCRELAESSGRPLKDILFAAHTAAGAKLHE